MLIYVYIYFFSNFVVVFHHKVCAFFIFIFLLDEVSSFHNRILRNQKQKLVISNCQWNPACNFIKKDTLARVFSWEFWELSRAPFLTEHLRWLLLIIRFTIMQKVATTSQFACSH